MLTRCLTHILSSMTLADALETTRIHRVAVRAGDHTLSDVAVIGWA
jgi:hypothetical protein